MAISMTKKQVQELNNKCSSNYQPETKNEVKKD